MAKYLKQDCELGYIEDSAKIEYLKLNNLRHSILGGMLGDFDEQGFYVVAPEIQKELLSMRKFIVESMDNVEICHGEIALDNPITFMVSFEEDRATLTLVEKLSYEGNFKINSGTYSNINEFVLDEVETAGEIDRNKIYKLWNIQPFGGNIVGIKNMDAETLALYAGLVSRYKYLLAANKIMLQKEQQLEEIEAQYSINTLELLKKYPALNKLVKAEIEADLKEKKHFIRLDKPNFAKTFNEVVDQAIENNISALEENELAAFEQEQKSILQTRNMQMQETLNVKTNPALEEEANVSYLDDEFLEGERTHKKIVLDTEGLQDYKSIGELQEEYQQAETAAYNRAQQNGLGFVLGAAAGVAGSAVAALIDGYIKQFTPLEQIVGEEIREQAVQEAGNANTPAKQAEVAAAPNNGNTKAAGKIAGKNDGKVAGKSAGKSAAKSGNKTTTKSGSKDKKNEKAKSTTVQPSSSGRSSGGMISGRVNPQNNFDANDYKFSGTNNAGRRANGGKTTEKKKDDFFDVALNKRIISKIEQTMNTNRAKTTAEVEEDMVNGI